MEEFLIPNGVDVNGYRVNTASIAEVAGKAEEIFTTRPSKTKLYTWFGKVISVAIGDIGGVPIASEFLKTVETSKTIPPLIRRLSFIDAGTLLLQVHRECWEDTLPEQEVTCEKCGGTFTADIDLKRLDIPKPLEEPVEKIVVKLSKNYPIAKGEAFSEFQDEQFNRVVLRVPLLEDAIRNEGLANDEVKFWRRMAFDTIQSLEYENEDGAITEIPRKYISGRGTLIFNRDLKAVDLKRIRREMQRSIPSALLFYSDTCKVCGEETRYFANVNSFFLA
jgi:hypothetical protein